MKNKKVCLACVKPTEEQLLELTNQANKLLLEIIVKLPLQQQISEGTFQHQQLVAGAGAIQVIVAMIMKEGKTYGDLKNILNSFEEQLKPVKTEEVKDEKVS